LFLFNFIVQLVHLSNSTKNLFILGTSTDVSRYDGEYEHVFETTTAGVTIQAPQVCYLQ